LTKIAQLSRHPAPPHEVHANLIDMAGGILTFARERGLQTLVLRMRGRQLFERFPHVIRRHRFCKLLREICLVVRAHPVRVDGLRISGPAEQVGGVLQIGVGQTRVDFRDAFNRVPMFVLIGLRDHLLKAVQPVASRIDAVIF
jgi:hypothetical protein